MVTARCNVIYSFPLPKKNFGISSNLFNAKFKLRKTMLV